jgi:hypothetical protein
MPVRNYIYRIPWVPSLIILVGLDHGAVYTAHLTVWTLFGTKWSCQSTLGGRASEQLHRHN